MGTMLVSDVMTPDPLTVGVEALVRDVRERILACGGHAVPVIDGDQRPVGEAARLMRRQGVHHLVVTRRGVIVGIVSSYDLLAVLERMVGDDGLPPVAVPHEPRFAAHG